MATCSRHAVGPLNICCNSNDWNNNCACKYCIYERGFLDYEDEVDCFIYIDLNPSLGAESLENFYNKTGGDDWFNNSGWLAGCSDTYD